MAAASPWLRAAVYVMAFRGLRVGGLPGLTLHGKKFSTITKGSEHHGTMSEQCLSEIRKAHLPGKTPFADYSASIISDSFYRLVKKLHAQGTLSTRYSVHDLRHYYAVTYYLEHKDIYTLKKLLHHSSILTTERYLKSLNIEEAE